MNWTAEIYTPVWDGSARYRYIMRLRDRGTILHSTSELYAATIGHLGRRGGVVGVVTYKAIGAAFK